MALVYEWARTVAFVVLFATLIEMLVTSEEMARYVRLVLGLVVLLAIMSPALQLIDSHWYDTGFSLTTSQSVLAPGAWVWEEGIAQQIIHMVSSVEGVSAVRVDLTSTRDGGLRAIQVRGLLSSAHTSQAAAITQAVTTTLAAYYGLLAEQVQVYLQVESIVEGR